MDEYLNFHLTFPLFVNVWQLLILTVFLVLAKTWKKLRLYFKTNTRINPDNCYHFYLLLVAFFPLNLRKGKLGNQALLTNLCAILSTSSSCFVRDSRRKWCGPAIIILLRLFIISVENLFMALTLQDTNTQDQNNPEFCFRAKSTQGSPALHTYSFFTKGMQILWRLKFLCSNYNASFGLTALKVQFHLQDLQAVQRRTQTDRAPRLYSFSVQNNRHIIEVTH